MLSRRRLLAAVALAGAASSLLVLVPLSPAAAAGGRGRHCVADVVDQKASGELVLSEARCHDTFASAMADTGVAGADGLAEGAASADLQAVAAASSDFIIGTHYDGAGLTGASFSVVGSDCGGGWLNLSSTWDNRVSSTANGCYRIRHFDGDNLTGASEDILGGGGNLWALNNRTNSIQYLP